MLFLNNAINHGVLTPLGTTEAVEQGKSVLFLLEANPGPGLGLLLAYSIFGKGLAKASAPGAAIIHFFGGIHEIYFPYVLMKPKLILAMIAGGMTASSSTSCSTRDCARPRRRARSSPSTRRPGRRLRRRDPVDASAAPLARSSVAALLLKTDKADEAEDDLAAPPPPWRR